MNRLQFDIEINAPQDLVWQLMWDKNTFSEWMLPMGEGHYFEPTLIAGGKIRWLTPNGDGMYGKVKKLIPGEKIVFEHQGWIIKGENSMVDTFKSEELYSLKSEKKITHVCLEVDTFDEYTALMKEKYPLVLEALKKIAEQHFFLKNQNINSI